jgi:hypothetical protein
MLAVVLGKAVKGFDQHGFVVDIVHASGDKFFHGVAPIRFFVSAGFRSSRVAVAVWLSVLPFDVSNLVDVWHNGQQQNEKNPK